MWDDIYKPNSIGSEGGTIIADEEYKESCRITLERCERYDAITCGVYGCMMHTAFCNKSHSQEVFDNMKKDLQEFIDKDTTADEESIFYDKNHKIDSISMINEFSSTYHHAEEFDTKIQSLDFSIVQFHAKNTLLFITGL